MSRRLKNANLFLSALLAITLLVSALPCFRADISRIKRSRALSARKKIMHLCESLNVRRGQNTEIYYSDADSDYAKITQGIINTYLPLLCADFGLSERPRVVMVIYPDKETMYSSIDYKPGGSSEPSGAYSAGILGVLSPTLRENDGRDAGIDVFLSEGTVIHELCHLLLDIKTNGNYSQWFAEGVALYYESRYTGRDPSTGPAAKPVSYNVLTDSFKYINEKESYRKSFEVIKFVERIAGEEALINIYNELESGKSLDKALRKTLGEYFPVLDKL